MQQSSSEAAATTSGVDGVSTALLLPSSSLSSEAGKKRKKPFIIDDEGMRKGKRVWFCRQRNHLSVGTVFKRRKYDLHIRCPQTEEEGKKYDYSITMWNTEPFEGGRE